MSAVIRALAAGLGAALLAAGPVIEAQPAVAAAPAARYVQFSSDGSHWSDSYAGALFGGVLLVPGGSVERPLYVRSTAPDAGILTVTLFDVTATDLDYAGALSVAASTPGHAGTAVPVTSARPCATLTQGQVLGSGDSIRIDTTAALADLGGTTGQRGSASFVLAVTLSSRDAAAPAPDTCSIDFANGGGAVAGTPDPGTPAGTAPVYHLGSTGWTPAPGTAAPATIDPEASASGTLPFVRDLVANTERLYQEYFVAYWIALAILGALILLAVRRFRSGDATAPIHLNSTTTRENGIER